MPEVGNTLIMLKFALVVQVGGQAQSAIGSLAGTFADSAAGTDIVKQYGSFLNRGIAENGLDRAFGYHFTFA